MDASALTTENIVATFVAGVGIGILGIWKYLKELKTPTTPNGDRIIPGLTIADMQPFRDLAAAQARSATAHERTATALEAMLALSQERAEDDELTRRARELAKAMVEEMQTPDTRRRRGT